MERTRIGFIGAGGIAHRRFGVLADRAEAEVRALCGPDGPRAHEAARRPGATAYVAHEAMLGSQVLDAVLTCVPPIAHGAPGRACLALLAGDVEEVCGAATRRDRERLDVPAASAATLRLADAVADPSATGLLRWSHRVGLHAFADGLAIEVSDHAIVVDGGEGRPVRDAEGDPVRREDRDSVGAVRGEPDPVRAPHREALTTHRVAFAGRSARTGRVIRMEGLRLNPQPPFRRAAPADARPA